MQLATRRCVPWPQMHKAGDFQGIRLHVEGGGDVMKRDFFNNTALHRSASMGFTVITRYLLDKGAEVDAVAKDGW